MGSSIVSSLPPLLSQDPTLAIVIVNYQSWDDVVALVGSLASSARLTTGECEVLIVDNASEQPVPTALRASIPGVRLILQPSNGGFSSGVNAGWRSSRSPWLLVLNPDIMAGPELIDQILCRISDYTSRPDAIPGVVGFGLRNADGTRQPSVGVFPSLVRTIWEQVIPRSRRKYQPEWLLRAGPVDWVTGACFLVAAPLLDELGGMDEDFFLYYEEVALCRTATRRGWSVEYDPSVAVVHLRPLQNRAISTKMRIITRHSKLLYFQKHLPPWEFMTLAWAIRTEAKVRAAWCRFRGRPQEVRGWQAVGAMAAGRPRATADLRGRDVLAVAQAVEDAADADGGPRATLMRSGKQAPVAARRGIRRSQGTRPTSP